MEELSRKEDDPSMLYVDNKATISLIKNPVLYEQSKHIEISFHYISECTDLNRGTAWRHFHLVSGAGKI